MPTFSRIALENLLEPKFKDSSSNEQKAEAAPKPRNRRRRVNISPELYTTPEPTPVIDYSSSDSISGSPYVFNRKGRSGKAAVNYRIGGDGIEVGSEKEKGVEEGGDLDSGELQFEERVSENYLAEEEVGGGDRVEDDDFLDTRCDSLSVGSCGGGNDFGSRIESLSIVSNQGDFFYADDDFSSDGSIQNALHFGQSIESEMCSLRLSLLEEIEKRKIAEDALCLMHNEWQRVGNILSAEAGLIGFPSPPTASSLQLELNSIDQFCQEVIVARFVSEAIGKGLARAEAELAAEAILKPKDQEISRLRDKLQYYEAVNQEMSQRNQEVIEVARRQRQKRKGLRKWLWSGIGLSIAIGASVIAYPCLPETSENEPLLTSSDSSDVSSIGSLQSA